MTSTSSGADSTATDTTIFTAKRVITMNPSNPFGEAVAVRAGRVLGVGTLDELSGWGPHTVDRQFEDKVLTPGFVEAHCHAGSGAVWINPYVGYFPRRAPDGVLWEGCKDIDAVVERLQQVDAQMQADGAPEDELIYAWGLDPLYFEGDQSDGERGARMYAEDLDRVSLTRPIYVHHVSGHLAWHDGQMASRTVNSRNLPQCSWRPRPLPERWPCVKPQKDCGTSVARLATPATPPSSILQAVHSTTSRMSCGRQ
jgi:predicted amidohydrolase YtcJ